MRLIKLALIALLIISCSPAAAPTEAPRPTINMVIEVASPTATEKATFTPIPPTFTVEPSLTPTIHFAGEYEVSAPKSISGAANARIALNNYVPDKVSVTSAAAVELFGILADGSRIEFYRITETESSNPLVALEIISTGRWTVDLIGGQYSATPTRIAVTVTRVPKSTVAQTKKPPIIVPTNTRVIILPTDTPVVVVVPPTNPPPPAGGCCKYCNPAKSKPCGDSCISLDKTCHVGQGCACSK